jgi:hypothetical protein
VIQITRVGLKKQRLPWVGKYCFLIILIWRLSLWQQPVLAEKCGQESIIGVDPGTPLDYVRPSSKF